MVGKCTYVVCRCTFMVGYCVHPWWLMCTFVVGKCTSMVNIVYIYGDAVPGEFTGLIIY